MRRQAREGHFARCKVAHAVASAFLAGAAPTLYALPDGGQVSAGSATIQRAGTAMTIHQSTDRAAIHWQSFGIAANESVRFNQPGVSSIVLNRVVGQDPSQMLGSLSANGQVFLLNPNGVLFGPGAQVSVGGIVASTLNLSDADFLAGRFAFARGAVAREVVNQGSITAASGGYVAFLGPQVRNEGVISAQLGTVVLAAGDRTTLSFRDNKLVSFAIEQGALDALAENRQLIHADGGEIVLSAKAADALARSVVNNSGILQARTISEKNGVIRLESAGGTLLVDGRIDATGSEAGGGTIRLLGERVGINSASVDASGATGGGTVLVGGDYQGANSQVQNASRTYVGPGVTLRADATGAGNGGKVIVWADDVTRFYGHISARGGASGGDGGFAEVSGRNYLDFAGTVDLTAANGRTGTLLLDPTNIEVVNGGAAALANVDQFADANLIGLCALFGGAACSQIAPATISAAGANVTLQATSNILFTDAISFTNAGVGLTATAQTGTITVNGAITTANRASSGTTGAVSLTAGGAIAVNANITTGNSSVADAGGNQTAASGAITLNAATSVTGTGRLITGTAAITAAAAAGTDAATSGNISITAGSGGVSGGIGLSSAGNALMIGTASRTGAVADTATTGNVVLSSRDEINDGTASTALGIIHGAASGATTNVAGTVRVTTTTAAGNAFLNVTGPLKLGVSSIAGNLSATSSGTMFQSGALTVTGTANLNAGANPITMNAANNFVGAVSVTNSGANNVFLTDSNALVLGTVSVGSGTLSISSGAGGMTQTGPITQAAGAGGVSLTAGVANALTLTNAGNDFVGPVRILTANNVTLTDANAFAFGNGGTSAISGSLSLTAGGAVTQANAVTVTGTTSISAGANAITLTNAANNYTGAVSLNNSGADTVAVRDSNAIVLGASSVGSGTLTVTAGGAITQTGAITQAAGAGAASFITGAATITLANAGNDFTGAVTLTNSGANNVAVRDANALALAGGPFGGTLTVQSNGALTQTGALTVTGTTSINAGAGSIALANAANNFTGAVTLANSGANNVAITDSNAIALGASGVGGGTLTVTAGGAITQTGAITQAAGAGAASFTTGAAPVTLTNAANDFTGAVSLNNSGANNVAVRDANAIVLGTSSAGSGTLTITAAGAITQSGPITQSGAGGVSIAAGAANNVTLSDAGNDFAGAVRIVSGNDVTLADSNAFAFGNGGTSAIAGNLVLTTGGAVTQANALTVAGTSSISAGANAITLTNVANNFTGAVSLSSSGASNVAVRDANAIVLGTSSVGSGTLTVTATGAITQSGAITQAAGAGAATFIAGANSITLTQANDFTGAVTLNNTGANNVSITDANSLALATESFGASLTVQTNGALTQTGALTVTGTTTINAGAGPIVLTNAANNFTGAVSLTNSGANNVAVTDANAILLGASSAGSGTLTITAGGAITQTAAITQSAGAGATTFTTGAAAITLTNAGNDFTGAVSASNSGANAIQLTDSNALQLGAISTASNLSVTAGGTITQTAAATVGGTTSLTTTAAGSDVLFNNASNSLAGNVAVNTIGAGSDADIRAAGNLALAATSTGGSFTAVAAGALTLSGSITAGASGDAIVLAAGTNFNNAGAFALNAGSGRWLVYSTSPAGSTEGGLTSAAGSPLPRLYNKTFAGDPPASIAAGNHLIYSFQPGLAITPDNVAKVYGTNDPAQTYLAASFVNDDGVTDNATTAGLGGSFARTAGESVASYAITQGTFGASAGYGISFTAGKTLSITQKPLTASVANQTKTYGADDPALPLAASVTGLVNATVNDWNGNATVIDDSALTSNATALTRAAGESAGAYNITAGTFTAPSANYSVPSFTGTPTLTINTAALTASVANQTKTYGADDPALPLAATSLTGLVNRTVATWNGNVVVDDSALTSQASTLMRAAGEAVGAYNITAGTFGTPSANYSAPTFAGAPTLTINTASLTASVANQTKTYGADDPALPIAATSLSGLVNRTVATWNGNVAVDDSALTSQASALTRAVGEMVGAYNISGGTFTAPSANYGAPSFTGAPTLTINKASLAGSIANQTKTYGADDPALGGIGVTLGGLLNASVTDWNGNNTALDDTGNVATTLASLSRDVGEVAGAYNVTGATFNALTGAAAGNYNAPVFTGSPTLTINTAALAASAGNQTKTYGADDPALPIAATSLTGLVNATVNDWNGSATVINDGALTSNATALTRAAGENVGSYNITGGTFTAPSANYSVPSFTGTPTLTINTKSVTASVANQTKTYGAHDPALPLAATSLRGLVNRTVATWNGNVAVDDSAWTSQASALTRAAGENVGIYNITAGTFSAPTANYSAPSFTGTPTLTINQRSLTASVANQSKTYGADDPALPVAATSLTGLVSATVNDWNGNVTVINDSALTSQASALTRAAGETVGAYNLTAGTFSTPSANYSAPSFTGTRTLTINPASLTITADDKTRAEATANPPLTATYSGFVLGEGPANLSGSLVLSTPAVVASPPGNYSIAASGHAASNYVIGYVDGVLTVTAVSGGGSTGGGGSTAGGGSTGGGGGTGGSTGGGGSTVGAGSTGGGSGTGAPSTDGALADAITSQQGRAGERPAVPGIVGPQGAEGRGQAIYEIESTGIRLPPGLQRP